MLRAGPAARATRSPSCRRSPVANDENVRRISGSNAVNALNGTYTLTGVTGNNTTNTTKTFTFVVASTPGGTTTLTPTSPAVLPAAAANLSQCA